MRIDLQRALAMRGHLCDSVKNHAVGGRFSREERRLLRIRVLVNQTHDVRQPRRGGKFGACDYAAEAVIEITERRRAAKIRSVVRIGGD